MYLDDPLFAEDWLARSGRRPLVYRPQLGARTWDYGPNNEALDELKEHASVTDDDDDLIRLHCEAALEGLDGFNGQLGVVLQDQSIVQEYSRLTSAMPLLGPVKTNPAPGLEYRLQSGDAWTQIPSTEFKVVDEVSSWYIRLNEVGQRRVSAYSYSNYGEPLARVSYTAGMASNLYELPADLKIAIYTLARRSFDFRDDTMPTSMTGFSKGGFLPTGVASILARYTKHVTI